MKLIVCSIFALTGLAMLLVGVLAVFDPQGSQLANDTDPFGVSSTPASVFYDYLVIIVGMALIGASIYIDKKK